MRTLIYARYSSQLQNDRSIEDQVALCRERAGREGWTVVEEFADRAISGAAGIAGRPGLAALLDRVAAGGVDQVLAESTDRLARHQGDDFAIRERLEFAGVRLFTLMEGAVDEITGTIKGLMNSRFRKDLAQRVKRGQAGNIREGRSSGSMAFGYRRVSRFDDRGEPIRGLREIDPNHAATVLRIFREYAAGQSAQAIVGRLNSEKVPHRREGVWRASSLIGGRARQLGILSNPIYIGKLLYGRSKQVVDPATRLRRFREGDSPPIEGDAPHLRIVDDELWEAVQAQLALHTTKHPHLARRPKRLLSKLGVCGVCGSNWVVTRGMKGGAGPDKTLWGCSAATQRACENVRLISTRAYEQRVLADLKAQMLAPDVVSAYLREYHREHARLAATLTRDRDRIERALADAARKVERLVAAIADGASGFGEVREALTAARADRERLTRELASLEALPVLTLHPGLADQYRRQVEELEVALADEHARLEAVPKLRALISRIVVTPREMRRHGGVNIDVVRHIDEVLNFANAPTLRRGAG